MINFTDLDGTLPAEGTLLADLPSDDTLASLDAAMLTSGETASGIYLGEDYGIVVYPDGTARAFPLAAKDVMIVRTCDGAFAQRVLRQTS